MSEEQIVIREPQPLISVSLEDMDKMATFVAASGMLGTTNKSAVQTLMLLCQSEGLHPIKALQSYDIIENKPSMKASAMVAKFKARGHHILIHIRDKDECSATFFETKPDEKDLNRAKDRYRLLIAEEKDNAAISDLSRTGEVTIIRTMLEAIATGLATGANGKPKVNWERSGPQMLYARCMSEGVNVIDPGIKAGMTTSEEIEEVLENELAMKADLSATDLKRRDEAAMEVERERMKAQGLDPSMAEPMEIKKGVETVAEAVAKKGKPLTSKTLTAQPKASTKMPPPIPATATPPEEKTQPQAQQPPNNVVEMPKEEQPPKPEVVEGELVLEEETAEAPDRIEAQIKELIASVAWAKYKIKFIKSTAYFGKELGTLDEAQIDLLHKKRGFPNLRDEDEGIRIEALNICAAQGAWEEKKGAQ